MSEPERAALVAGAAPDVVGEEDREIIARELVAYFSFESMGPRKTAWLDQALRVVRRGVADDPVVCRAVLRSFQPAGEPWRCEHGVDTRTCEACAVEDEAFVDAHAEARDLP